MTPDNLLGVQKESDCDDADAVGVAAGLAAAAVTLGAEKTSGSPAFANATVAGHSPVSGSAFVAAVASCETASAASLDPTATLRVITDRPMPSAEPPGRDESTGTPWSGGAGGTYGDRDVDVSTPRWRPALRAAAPSVCSNLRRCPESLEFSIDTGADDESMEMSLGVITIEPLDSRAAKMLQMPPCVVGFKSGVVPPTSTVMLTIPCFGDDEGVAVTAAAVVGVALPLPPDPPHSGELASTSSPSRHSVPDGVDTSGDAAPDVHRKYASPHTPAGAGARPPAI